MLSFILHIQLEIWGCFCIYLLYWMNFSCGHRPIRWQICPVMGKLVCINSWNKVKSKTNSTYKKKVKIRHLKGFSQDNSFCLRIPVEPFGTMELPFHDYRSQELQRGTKQGSVLLSGEEPWGRAPGSVQSLCFGLSSATWWNQQIPILPLRLWCRQQKVPNISSHSWKEVLFKKKKRKKATTVSLESHLWTV